MKNTRKNKTNQVLNMPKTPYYKLQELFALNPQFNAEITIRVRHTKEIEAGRVAEIGSMPGGKGRPLKVYAYTPVSQATLNRAKASGMNPVDNVEKLINAISVTSPSPVTNIYGESTKEAKTSIKA